MKKLISLFLILIFFCIFFLFSLVFLLIIAENIPGNSNISLLMRDVFEILLFGLTIILTFCYLLFESKCYKSNKNFNNFSIKLLAVFGLSCLIAFLLAYMFGNSPYWFLKYTIGCFVGLFFYLFNQKENTGNSNIISGVISIFALLYCEAAEYGFAMDPSEYPTILRIRSFLDIIFWFGIILVVFFTSYLFSKGFLIKKMLKKRLSAKNTN